MKSMLHSLISFRNFKGSLIVLFFVSAIFFFPAFRNNRIDDDSATNEDTGKKIGFVQVVKFKSTLPDSIVQRIMNQRKILFMKVPGLVQKYYLREQGTGEYSGIYLWKSEQDFLNYRKTDLAKTIAQAYQVEGKPRLEVFEVICPLRK